MDLHQGNKTADDGLGFPVLTYADVVKQSFLRFAQQPKNNGGSSIQVTDKFDTNLQDINEDCLLEIFSLKILDPMDLCSLAETCRRFKRITQRVFPKFCSFLLKEEIFDNIYYILGAAGYNLMGEDSDKFKEMVFRVFKNFGSCLSAVAIGIKYNASLSQHVLSLLATYCGDNLKSLELMGAYIPEELKVQLKPIFKQLQKLVIGHVEFDTNLYFVPIYHIQYINSILTNYADCDSLVELELYVKCCDAIFVNTFLKLERLRFLCADYGHNCSVSYLLGFISRHNSLKTVDIIIDIYYTEDGVSDRILQTISRNCPELHELYIYDDHWDPTGIIHFDLLSQLKKLRIFYLNGGIDVILNIIRLAVSLEELQFDLIKDTLTKEDFSAIVNLVKGRSKVLILKGMNFSMIPKNCDKNQKVKFVPCPVVYEKCIQSDYDYSRFAI